MGIDKHQLPAMAKRGTLIKRGYGVYLAKHHIPKENDVFAHSVALAGGTAYLRGASVVALLKLAPTNPGIVYLGATTRVRRRLPANLRLVDMRPAHDLIDLQLILSQEDIDMAATASVCRELFRYRRKQPWPTSVVKNDNWAAAYSDRKGNLNVLPIVDEAIAWANELIASIDKA